MSDAHAPDIQHDLIERARRVLPAGGFGNFPTDVVIARGQGGRVWDEAGREYIDFLLGSDDNLVSAYFSVTGPWIDPEASLITSKSIAKGPASFMITDPDGNQILIDQFF